MRDWLRRAALTVLGATWWWALRVRRAEATASLARCLPGVAPGPVLRHAVGSAALGYLELALGGAIPIQGLDTVADHLRSGRGLWCLAGHLGPWDLLLVRASARVPVSIFVRPPSDRISRAAVAALRRAGDLELLDPREGFPAALRAYAAGRVVVFVQDQRHARGEHVPFFGHAARTSTGLARALAAHPGPVLWAEAWRAADGAPQGALRLLTPPPTQVTAWSQALIEDAVRARPADWWWLHRRWR